MVLANVKPVIRGIEDIGVIEESVILELGNHLINYLFTRLKSPETIAVLLVIVCDIDVR
jgi:hypothetical protein